MKIKKLEDIKNCWLVEFRGLRQYVEANSCDEAIEKAKKTFQAHFYNIKNNTSSTTQKACKHTKLNGKYRICFAGNGAGHVTIDATNKTIYQVIEEAFAMDWLNKENIYINEIFSVIN